MHQVDTAFDEAVHWKRNILKVPQGNAGKLFAQEVSRLFSAFATASTMEALALKAATLLPLLVLQKPHRASKTRDHVDVVCLQRRLALWAAGDIEALVKEGRVIQKHLLKRFGKRQEEHLSCSFANLMFLGKTQEALDLLSQETRGELLHLSDLVNPSDPSSQTVKEALKEKHPTAHTAPPEALIQGELPDINPIIFDAIDASAIRLCALCSKGAAGPLGLDASAWRRLCTSYKSASNALCQSLAQCAKRLWTEYVDPDILAPLLSCRLIALNKNLGVRPIGIGEIPRRIMAKAVLGITRGDIQDAAGALQLSAGQIAGVETAVHVVQDVFQEDETEAALLVDATNAFNTLNRAAALHNIRLICPSLSTVLINCYRAPTQ